MSMYRYNTRKRKCQNKAIELICECLEINNPLSSEHAEYFIRKMNKSVYSRPKIITGNGNTVVFQTRRVKYSRYEDTLRMKHTWNNKSCTFSLAKPKSDKLTKAPKRPLDSLDSSDSSDSSTSVDYY
jgi:hypothetical protein